MRVLYTALLTLLLAAPVVQAQEDLVFRDYDDYARFVDANIMERDFTDLILRLGGRDKDTPEELKASAQQLRTVWPRDFDNADAFRREDLGVGITQEARIYWTSRQYDYSYALLHARDDGFVVLSFHINTSSKRVLERF